MSKALYKKRISPAQTIVLGFAAIILLGALLLALPVSSADGKSIGALNALFTATSGVCVTGLSVVEIGTTLSLFGQVTLLCLIQIGGLGIMICTALIYFLLGRRIGLAQRVALKEALNESALSGIVKTARNALIITAAFEGVGILIFMTRFIPVFGVEKGVFMSIFHSISSFCNAGFDIIGTGDNITRFGQDGVVMIMTMILIVAGGLGFFVIIELGNRLARRKRRLTTHSKIALLFTAGLLIAGFLLFYIAEHNNPATMGNMNEGDKVMASLFQSVTTRTAGFMTIPQSGLTPFSKLITVVFMFIGASPAGTGGGVKTTTIAVIILFAVAVTKGSDEVVFFKRRVNKNVIFRAIAVLFLAVALVLIFMVLLCAAEHGRMSVGDLFYELVSAFGTVGLSTGITASLLPLSKAILILTMFAGRVGLLTLTFAIGNRLAAKTEQKIKYPEDKVMIG